LTVSLALGDAPVPTVVCVILTPEGNVSVSAAKAWPKTVPKTKVDKSVRVINDIGALSALFEG
jgi:hypothetical protein